MRVLVTSVGVAALAVSVGCGGSGEASGLAPATPAEAVAVAPAAAPAQTSVGTVPFTVDGRARQLDVLREQENRYRALASSIRAFASAGATEQLVINVLSIDLKKVTYPTDLPLPKTPGLYG